MENKALGKGLSALISRANQDKMEEVVQEANKKVQQSMENLKTNVATHLVEHIDNNPLQPRRDYNDEDLNELKASIKEKGILQPILVRPRGDRFEVVAGERRLRAARAIGLTAVPVVVKDVSDEECLLLALVENIQRQDLNVIEEAKAFEKLTNEFNLTQDQIAQSVGKDRTTIANTLRLLKLPDGIQQHLINDRISMGHARALLAVENQQQQLKMAEQIIAQNLSVRSVEGLAAQASQKKPKTAKNKKEQDPDIANLEEELRLILGTKVMVEDKKGRGRLVIEYYSLTELDRILDIIRKNHQV